MRPVRVDPRGLDGPTRGQAAGPHWRRTTSGFYVRKEVTDELPEQRILEQAMRLPPGGAVTGWAGCRIAGAAFLDGLGRDGQVRRPVQLAVGPRGGIRRDDQVIVSHERLPEWEVWVRHGIRVARPERAVFDEMRRHGRREALVVADCALAGRITSLQRLCAYAATHSSARRFKVVEWALARASEHARSPNEVRTRTIAEEVAGLPRLLVGVVVLDVLGRRIGEVDLLDPEAGLVIEFDGADHREGPRHSHDITKEDRLRRAGLEVVRVTGSHLDDEVVLVERLRVARERAGRRPPYERRWSVAARAFDLETWLREREDLALWHENLPPAVGW